MHGCNGIFRATAEDVRRRHADWGERLAQSRLSRPVSRQLQSAWRVGLVPSRTGGPSGLASRLRRLWRARLPPAARRRAAGRSRHARLVAGRDRHPVGELARYPGEAASDRERFCGRDRGLSRLRRHRGAGPIGRRFRVHLFVGDADDWTPAAPCKAFAEKITVCRSWPIPTRTTVSTRPMRQKRVLTGIRATKSHTATIGTDPEARADLEARARDFGEDAGTLGRRPFRLMQWSAQPKAGLDAMDQTLEITMRIVMSLIVVALMALLVASLWWAHGVWVAVGR